MTTILRPYQQAGNKAIRLHALHGGKGAVLHMPTGAGKTASFSDFLKKCHERGTKAIMVVRRKALVHQASERLKREGIPHGIIQGNNTRDTNENILLCSIDTLYARRYAPEAKLIIVDECHDTHSDGYYWLFEQYPNTFKLGVSATPHHKMGMSHFADTVVCPITIADLIKQGYLVGGKYFVPYIPDTRGVKVSNGDFSTKDLGEKLAHDAKLTHNAAKVWRENLKGKSTFCYATNIKHAQILSEELEKHGARTRIIVGSTKDDVRQTYLEALDKKEIDVIVSVGVLTTGVDLPSLEAIMCCRPTKSYNLWIQVLGRGTRPYPGKNHFLVYDLSGNIHEHGPIELEKPCILDPNALDTKKDLQPEAMTLVTCPKCLAIMPYTGQKQCVACQNELNEATKNPVGKRLSFLGERSEVTEYKIEPWEHDLVEMIEIARAKGHKKGSIFYKLKAKYGDEIADRAWPRIRAVKKWPIKTAWAREFVDENRG